MVDRDLILAKAGSVKRHLNRVFEKRNTDLRTFLKDIDIQESILFNIQMAVQNCIDIAAHIISDEGLGVPGSTNEMFYLLEENGYLNNEITEKMVKAVGLRNLVVHEYGKIDLDRIFEVAQKDISDLNEYLKSIFKKLAITSDPCLPS
ncbi:MAG: DUF86 domain-containing protein [Deltaproteobacteria bacterium]|nr:DUF86 domain-containing protein [Deltaproteobacteria bacterium]